ncbi:aminotransferase class III-fold pyridoxal phosphate-dependent enzyme [Streptomyces griseus]|uniref:aminotransferase class III-fold pyridoxal phosphate-dependent enzyme n=1 Tax=Streptomyces TaxID=1883 RepID=UPI0004C89F3D|nr:aminotransferase class III-fold pyridoxal phosphate-dependent enzyme [Streptomyces griseus]
MAPEAQELVDGTLHQNISGIGLDPTYVRAEGNSLWAAAHDGSETEIADFVCGYGSLLLGHNNPEIVAYATEVLNARTPIHSQFSRRPEANKVTEVLNRIARREFGTADTYFGVFANTGAEAVEAAVKHAELDRGMRVLALVAQVTEHTEQARAAVASGAATVDAATLTRLGITSRGDGAGDLEALLAEVEAHNGRALSKAPVFFTLEGGFHGKLAASIQLTHNPSFRTPFTSLATNARFLPVNSAAAVRPAFEAARATVLDPVVTDGTVEIAEVAAPVFGAFFVEPIQGEGGIVPLAPEFAKEIAAVSAEFDCPVVVDEIQSGSGRTGAFFAASQLGLQGDYITLAKSIAGGVAKLSVLLVRESRYRPEFELLHSSTFAKDGFSTLIAQKTLEIMERDGGEVYRRATERGARLLDVLESVRADFPDVVKDVRGRGLLLGLELHDQSGSASPNVAGAQAGGVFGYLVSGFLLHRHAVRVLPTSSAPNTLRLQPSVDLTDAQIERLDAGLREACAALRTADEATLLGFLGARTF